VRGLTLLLLALLLPAFGCDGPAERPAQAPASALLAPESVSWPSTEGADVYAVEIWVESRLVLSTSTADTVLALDPAVRRALDALEGVVELQVLPVAAGGEPASTPWRGRVDRGNS
jgi:hypothetical protein